MFKFLHKSFMQGVLRKALGVPNMDPGFWESYGALSRRGGEYPNKIATDPGSYHVWVYKAVKTITDNFNEALPCIYSRGNEKALDYDHPIIDLMKKPNPFMEGQDFFSAILRYLLTRPMSTPGGQCFIVGDSKDKFGRGEIPNELWVFSDVFFTPKLNAKGILDGWDLKIPGTEVVSFDLDEVIRIKLFNPNDLTRGFSPLNAAMAAVDTDSKAIEFNTNFLKNNASLGGIVSAQNAMTPHLLNDIQKQWGEQYSGYKNAGKTIFLTGPIKYDSLSHSHQSFQYLEQLRGNREQILSVYGLRAFTASLDDATNRATASESRRALWSNAIDPYLTIIRESLNSQWIKHIGNKSLRIHFDKSSIEAMKEAEAAKVDIAQRYTEIGVPPAAAFEYLDIKLDTSKYPWLSDNQSSRALIEFPKEQDPDKDIEKTALIEIVKSPLLLPAKREIYTKVEVVSDEMDKLSDVFIEKMFTPGEKSLKNPIIGFFHEQRNAFQDQVDEVFKNIADASTLTVAHFKISQARQDEAIRKMFAPRLGKIAEHVLGITRYEIEAKKALDQDSTFREIQEFLKKRLLLLSVVNDTTFKGYEKQLAETLAKGKASNLSPKELAKSIKSGNSKFFKDREPDALKIARTESAVVSNTVRYNVFKNLDKPSRHTWLSSKDHRVRHSHSKEHGNTVTVGQRFPVTKLLHPGDPNGPAEETINCRCVAILERRNA